ncbi:MAG: hypothetical protein WDN75_01825 [Bacteroidota bacterium]
MGIDNIHLNFNENNLWALNLCLALIMFGVALDLKVDDFRRIAQSPKALSSDWRRSLYFFLL